MAIKEFLRERDEKLLDFLYQFKVATVDDIRDMAFDGIVKCHVYRRLKELAFMGLVQKIPYQKGGRCLSAYSLGGKSFKRFITEGDGPKGRQQFLSGKVMHDLSIVSIYREFIKSPEIVDFITENVLMSNSSEVRSYGIEEWIKNNPDGILIDEAPKGRYFLPLECELSVKKGFRYETKLIHYYQSGKIPAVIYICGNDRVRDVLCRIDKKYCHAYRPKVFYGLFEQFQMPEDSKHNGRKQLVFKNRNGGQIKF